MAKISAIVLTYNEEAQIAECLESIKWVDEIIVVDSLSSDKTVSICKEYTDKIHQREYQRYARTRNWSLQFATHDWVLIVDADERYTPDLREEIQERLNQDIDISAYSILFKYFCFGAELKNWRKDERHIRLFKKDSGKWQEREVHPKLIIKGKISYLKNPLSHYPYPNLRVFFDKMGRYTSWDAQERLKTKDKFLWFEPLVTIFKPIYNFISYYFLRSAYRDGVAGFLMSLFMSFYTFLVDIKYYLLVLKRS